MSPPPKPKKSRPSRGARDAAPQAPAAIEPVGPPRPSQPVDLSPLLTDSERRALSAEVDKLLAGARRNLDQAARRPAGSVQRERMNQARSFIQQAQEARARDLAIAKSLAERAMILSTEALAP